MLIYQILIIFTSVVWSVPEYYLPEIGYYNDRVKMYKEIYSSCNDSCTKTQYCEHSKCYSRRKGHQDCRHPSHCLSNKCTGWQCVDPDINHNAGKKNGERCQQDNQCQSHQCLFQKCRNPIEKIKCKSNSKCESNVCKNGQCQINVCGGSTECGPGEFCNRAACDKKRDVGTFCKEIYWCKTGSCVNRKCAALKDNGKPCNKYFECKTRVCHNRKCIAPRIGLSCKKNADCDTGLCYHTICNNKVDEGQLCVNHNECLTDLCFNHRCRSTNDNTLVNDEDIVCDLRINNVCVNYGLKSYYKTLDFFDNPGLKE